MILLLDGDPQRAARLAERLRSLGCETRVAVDAARGLQLSREVAPDVVVAVAEMAAPAGMDLLQALRMVPRAEIPLVLLTEDDSQEELVRGWTAGADVCIPRSFGEEEVPAVLFRLLAGARARPAAHPRCA